MKFISALIFIIYLTLASPAQSAITQVGAGSFLCNAGGSTTLSSVSYSTTTGTLKELVFLVTWRGANADYNVSSATWDGQGLTLVSGTRTVQAVGTEIWQYNLGTHTGKSGAVSITLSGSAYICVLVMEFDGVDQTTPFSSGTSVGDQQDLAITRTVSGAVATKLVIDVANYDYYDTDYASQCHAAVGASQTPQINNFFGTGSNALVSTQDGSNGGVMSWALTCDEGAAIQTYWSVSAAYMNEGTAVTVKPFRSSPIMF